MQTTQQSTQLRNGNLPAGGLQSEPQQSHIDVYTDARTASPLNLTVDNQSIAASTKPYSSVIACKSRMTHRE